MPPAGVDMADHLRVPGRGSVRIVQALALTGWLLIPCRLAAQTATGTQKPLQYTVNVTLKLVQVYVTGADGQPVADLAPAEFEITDNGRAVSVTHFERHFLGNAEPTAAAPAPRLSRKFILLFDFAFMEPRGVLKAREVGLKFIEATLRPEDEVALMAYSPYRGLILYEYLTLDHQRIRRLVESFGMSKATGRAENLTEYLYSRDLPEEQMPRAQQRTPEEDFFLRQARLQASQRVDEGVRLSYVDKARDFITALSNLALALRRFPGFKNVILFSEGIAQQVLFGRRAGKPSGTASQMDQLVQQMRDYDSTQADAGIRADFTRMLDEFKASNAPIYTLDVSRGQGDSDFPSASGPAPGGQGFEGTDSLRQLASVTGGRFYANTVNKDYVAGDIQNVTGAYYVLGYSIGETWDGKFHRIKVRVKRKGCEVVAQGGYFNPKPYRDYTSFEKLLQVTDLALSDVPQFETPKEITVSAMAVNVKGEPRLMAFARAPRATLGDVLDKKAEAYLLLLDESGEVASVKSFKLPLPDEKAGKEVLFPGFLLAVRPGRYTCRMVLRNMGTGLGARGSASLVVPGAVAAPVTLDPPLLLVPDAKSLDLAASRSDSLSAIFGYDPNSYAPLVGDIPAGLKKLIAALRCSSTGPSPDFEVSASLQEEPAPAPTGVPVSVLKRSSDGPISLILTEIATGDLRPGRYSLKLQAKDVSGGGTAATVVNLVVK